MFNLPSTAEDLPACHWHLHSLDLTERWVWGSQGHITASSTTYRKMNRSTALKKRVRNSAGTLHVLWKERLWYLSFECFSFRISPLTKPAASDLPESAQLCRGPSSLCQARAEHHWASYHTGAKRSSWLTPQRVLFWLKTLMLRFSRVGDCLRETRVDTEVNPVKRHKHWKGHQGKLLFTSGDEAEETLQKKSEPTCFLALLLYFFRTWLFLWTILIF